MAATMTRIAEEAGVSVGVVSRLLRGDPTLRVSESRRRQILEVKDRLGGVKSRPRKRRLTRTILVPINRAFSADWVVENLSSSEYIRSMEAELGRQNFRFHFTFFDMRQRRAFYQSMIYEAGHCDGLLLLSGEADAWLAELLRIHDFPHVSADFHAEQHRVNTVRAHAADGFRQAVEHLRQLGHERVGYLGPRKNYRYGLTVAALASAALPHDESVVCWVDPPQEAADFDAAIGQSRGAFGRWIERGPTATAMICANDWYAVGAVQAMRDHGLVPGRELSLVGHDNLEVRGKADCGQGEPLLTTIDNPTDLIGRRAANLLLNQVLHGQTQVVHERIPSPLIVRSSTGPRPEAGAVT